MKKNTLSSLFGFLILGGLLMSSFLLRHSASTVSMRSNLAAISGAGSGLVAHYMFDGNTNDSVGANHGTATGGPAFVTGKIGQAMSFDGVDDRISVGTGLNNLSSLSASAWINASSIGTSPHIISTVNTTTNGWRFAITGSLQRLEFMVDYDNTDLSVITANNTITLGQWDLYTVTWDGTANASGVHIYKNGVEVAYSTQRNGIGNRVTDTRLMIGNINNGARPFSGGIDDVRLYNRVLSAGEVSQLYSGAGESMNLSQNGQCSTTLNACTTGSFSDVPDTNSSSLWSCMGTNSGATASCSLPISPAADTAAPTVSVAAPGQNAALAGVVDIMASASDNVGVASVQFRVDGNNVGTPDASAPYAYSLNTATLSNGSHAITAVASDAAGNVTTSAAINVTVSNQVVPAPIPQTAKAWSYPGVPYTDWAYDPFTYPTPTKPAEWPAAAKQNYYFIAPNDPNATDAVTQGEPVDANGKRFGYPNKPRKTLPLVSANTNSFPAGTVFWLKGGTYARTYGSSKDWTLSVIGTPNAPFWIYGDPDEKPVFTDVRISIYNSQYGFIENIIWDAAPAPGSSVTFNRNDKEGQTHHIAMRNLTIQNRNYVAHGSHISIVGPTTPVDGDIHDIVSYKITFKNNGGGVDWNVEDADMHGYKINGSWGSNRAYRIWVIENTVLKGDVVDPLDGFKKSLAGNFIQVGDQLVTQGNVDHVWIAGNYSEGTRQGCVGLKRSGHVVVSTNVCRDLAQAGSSQGQAFNIKYDRQENQWFVNNFVENVDAFIIRAETTSSGAGGSDTFSPINTRVYIIGNIFKDVMRQPWNAPDMGGIGGWKTKGISIQDMNGKVYVANNVIDTSDYGVYFDPHSNRQSAGSEMHVYNNIAVNLSAGLDTSIAANNGIMITTAGATQWFIENNLVDSGRFYFAGTQYTSAAAFNARLNASGNMQGDPMFANPGADDYSLRAGSPAIDAGIRNYTTNSSPDVYQLFINAFANDPDFPGNPADVWPKDIHKNPRISGSGIDMGAVEYQQSGNGSFTPPAASDTDGDSVSDSNDRCPRTPSNLRNSVNRHGCVSPRLTTFDIRTDLSSQDLLSVPALELGRTGYGKVRWNQAVSVSRDSEEMNIDAGLTFSQNKVTLNSAALPELNRPAQVTLYNVNVRNPKILKDGIQCLPSACSLNSYANGTAVFTVTGFSTYEVVEGTEPSIIVPDTYVPPAAQAAVTGGGGGTSGGIGATTYNNQQITCPPGALFDTATGMRCTSWSSSGSASVGGNVTASQYAFTKTLKLGMRDVEVRALQRFLNDNGYAVAIRGVGSAGNESTYFGQATRAALMKYQSAKGLAADGVFGPRSRATVQAVSYAPSSDSSSANAIPPAGSAPAAMALRLGSSGEAVKALRQKLRAAGYFAPYGSGAEVPASAAAETSNFGATTEAAVKRFQCDKGIACSGTAATTGWGSVGARTRAALGL